MFVFFLSVTFQRANFDLSHVVVQLNDGFRSVGIRHLLHKEVLPDPLLKVRQLDPVMI